MPFPHTTPAGDYRSDFGGTSCSTPLAAALAALLLSIDPDLTAVQVKQIMQETADKIGQADGQYVAGHSLLYGYGRINAHRAAKRAAGVVENYQRTPAARRALEIMVEAYRKLDLPELAADAAPRRSAQRVESACPDDRE